MTERVATWAGSPRSRALAWAFAGVASVGFVGLCAFDVHQGGWPALAGNFSGGVAMVLFFVSLGTLLSLRQPANRIGWLLTAGGLTWLVNGFADDIPKTALAAHRQLSTFEGVAAATNQNMWVLGVTCSVGLPLLLFPAGRTRSPGWHRLLTVMIGSCALTLLGSIVSTTPVVSPLDPKVTLVNPWGIPSLSSTASVMRGAGIFLLFVSMLGAVAGIVVRFRSASGAERQQLRWVRYGAGLAVGGMLSVLLGHYLRLSAHITDSAVTMGIGLLPVCFTVAILRYRLYDLDRIISRTVTYALVTGLLVATYVGLVTAVSRLTPSSSALAVAASTLAVAALFQPVRSRIQLSVDRRFNRARVDADRTVEAFRRRLREQVSLDLVRADLLAVACETMQPASAGVWLRGSGASR